jgi:hypothetical protein
MSFLGEEFSADKLPSNSGSFDPIPAGEYTAQIVKADVTTTKAGTGEYIAVRFDVTGPTHQGRVVFSNLNIKNPNPKAEEIGQQQLGDIMRAIGLTKVKDTDQLIGGNLLIKVIIKSSAEWGDRNEVKAFKALSGSSAPAPKAETNDGPGGAPWEK